MIGTVGSLVSWVRSLSAETVEKCLLEDRRRQDFIGRHLPFTLVDDRAGEPVRYELGDDWLDLMVLYEPGYGWEVHVLDRSSEDFDLGDVYDDLRELLRAELAVLPPPPTSPVLTTVIAEIMARLENLEQQVSKSAKVEAVQSPYLNAEEAAAYLRTNVNALYSLVERRKLRPLPGHRKYRFTREMLDNFLRGE